MAAIDSIPLHYVRGEQSEYPQDAVKVFEGAMLGDNSGYARGLVAGDRFVGHSQEEYDNSDGSQGDHNITRLRGRYRLQVTLSSVAITDVGADVYASADDTLTLTKGSNSWVGRVDRYVTTDTAVVEFQTTEGGETAVPLAHIADPAATASDPDALTATAIAASDATTPGTGADATTPSGAEYTTCANLANELKVDYTALLADVTSIRTQLVAAIDDIQANNAAIDSILAQLVSAGIQSAS